MGLSARVIGTGFAIRRDLLEALDGFPCRTLTEDAELYAACLCRGAQIGYCERPLHTMKNQSHGVRLSCSADVG